jgi:heme oxygenase
MFAMLARMLGGNRPATTGEAGQEKPARRCPFGFDRLKKASAGPAAPASGVALASADAAARPLAEALKARTAEAHTRAEKHPVQERMVKGQVSRGEYAAWLRQMLPIWLALDEVLGDLARADGRVAGVYQPYHPHAERVRADLAFMGEAERGATAAALEIAARVRTMAAGQTPAGVLGVWYVLEGSANGGRFIAKALSRSLSMPGPEGLTSLDPHGEAQRERWQAWREAMNAQGFSPAEREAMVAAAVWTFEAIYAVMEEMSAGGGGAAGPEVVVPGAGRATGVAMA